MIIITFVSLIGLLTIHEFGHFILAKKFGVRVEEFGIGYPPKIFGKKIGETFYSLNLLPFGAFVRFPDENNDESKHRYSQQPIGKRMAIILGGVISFWIIAAILLGIVFTIGTRMIIDDDTQDAVDPRVQITIVNPSSPAEMAGIKPGDIILTMEAGSEKAEITKVKDFLEFTNAYLGEKIILSVERGKEKFDTAIVPRQSPPLGEGPLGVAINRTVLKNYPWYSAIPKGVSATLNLTIEIIQGYYQALVNVSKGVPSGVEPVGPVGIFQMVNQMGRLGINYLLQFLAIISIYLAIFNALPIPVVDGGKALFLFVEKIRKKPISRELEQKIDGVFFTLLIVLMILVTIKDISKLF